MKAARLAIQELCRSHLQEKTNRSENCKGSLRFNAKYQMRSTKKSGAEWARPPSLCLGCDQHQLFWSPD